MSKKNTKKQARKANILTLGVTDLAPIVGSIIADKDTIIIKKMSNGAAAVFFSDQNGNVIGTGNAPTPPKNPEPPKEKPSIDLASLTQDDIFYLKNALHTLEETFMFVMGINSNKFPDLKLVIYINGNRLEYAGYSSRVFVKQGDVIEVKSRDYPNMNFAIDGEFALGEGKDFRIMAEDIESNIFFSDFEGTPPNNDLPPMPAAPPEETPIRHSEADIVWEKNIRVFFPTPITYSVAGETKTGNGWTDIRIYVNGEDLFINGAQTGEGNSYAAEENSVLVYGDNGGVPVNLTLNFNDVEEGMTLTFSQVD